MDVGAVAQTRGFVRLDDCDEFSITGCVMRNATSDGISINGTSSRGVITGNVIGGYVDGTPNSSGIYNASSGNDFVYVGNKIGYFLIGIYINTVSDNHLVTGNIFNDLTTALSSAGTTSKAKTNIFENVTNLYAGTWSREFYATATVDPASVPNGTYAAQLVTVTGAALGDFVNVAAPYDLAGMQMSASVQAANTVALYFRNDTGGALDLASGTWKFYVHS
jgi:hypothetical protein